MTGAGAPDPADPGLRGGLVVAPRAVEKVVAQAATEASGASGGPARVLGLRVGGAAERPRVRADVTGDLVTAELEVSLPWGVPLQPALEGLRARVREQVASLTGLRVGHLDVLVTALPVAPAAGRVA